jgi:hypothetical protein
MTLYIIYHALIIIDLCEIYLFLQYKTIPNIHFIDIEL